MGRQLYLYIQIGMLVIWLSVLLAGRVADAQSCSSQSVPSDTDFHILLVNGGNTGCTTNGTGNPNTIHLARTIVESFNRQWSFKLGLQVISTCEDESVSSLKVVTELSRQALQVTQCGGGGRKVVDQGSTLIGVIDNAGIADAQQILKGTDIPLIKLGETLPATTSAKNLFYASNSLTLRAKAIADLAVKLNWDYTTVAYASDSTSKDLKLLLEKELKDNLICVDDYIEYPVTATGSQIVRNVTGEGKPSGVILIGVPNNVILNHITQSHITWILSPRLPEEEEFKFSSDSFNTVYHIQQHAINNLGTASLDQVTTSLFALITSVQSVLEASCSGDLSSCTDLAVKDLHSLTSRKLSSIKISYDEIRSTNYFGYLQNGSFSIVDHQVIHEPPKLLYKVVSTSGQEANYSVDRGWDIEVNTGASNQFWCINEKCRSKCSHQLPPSNYTYLHGDFILVVTMPIHDSFNGYPDLWSCKEFNNEASLRAEAAIFARERLNTLLKDDGINLGLLILDTCFNTALTQKLLTDVLNGTTEYCNKDHCLDRSKIIGLIGDYSSHISTTEQRLMIPANLIHVAYGAATWKLDDKSEFTHFLRTHPSATQVMANLIKVLNKLNQDELADVNSVVLITTDSLYGASGGELLRNHLSKSNYCIRKSFELSFRGDETAEKYGSIWSTLRAYDDQKSFVVIYVGEEKPIRDLLDNMNVVNENWWRESGSIFIMTEVWEDRIPLIEKYGHILRGSLTFKIKPDFGVLGFKNYLSGLRINSPDTSSWFSTMLQRELDCKVRGSFDTSHSTVCAEDKSFLKDSAKYNVEIYALYVLEAVYAFGYGFLDYARRECDENTALSECDLLLHRQFHYSQELKHNIGRVRIPRNDSSSRANGENGLMPFDDNFDGRAGYQVFQQGIDPESRVLRYKYFLVYEFDTDNELSMPASITPAFYQIDRSTGEDSQINVLQSKTCDSPCSTYCSDTTAEPVTVRDKSVTIIAACTGAIIFLLLALVVFLAIKKYGKRCRKTPDSDYLKSSASDTYMSPETGTDHYTMPRDIRPHNLSVISSNSNRQPSDDLPSTPAPNLSQLTPTSSVMYTTHRADNKAYDNLHNSNIRHSNHSRDDDYYIVPAAAESTASVKEKPTPVPRQASIRSTDEVVMTPNDEV